MNINKYKFQKITLNLIITAILLPSMVRADTGNPNGINNKPESGWSLWRVKAEVEKADFSAGFSNLELGGYLDFENACKTSSKPPESQIEYWFRLSNSVNRIGTGKAEFGCWDGKKFLYTHTSTAVKNSLEYVDCLSVKSADGSLLIWSEPTRESKILSVISNGKTVKYGSFPATIINQEDRNLVKISSPMEGWISDGSTKDEGNLRLCNLPSQTGKTILNPN